jgi:hypothetical protein
LAKAVRAGQHIQSAAGFSKRLSIFKGGTRVTPSKAKHFRRVGAALLTGTILGGWSMPLLAQDSAAQADQQPPVSQPATAAPQAQPAAQAPTPAPEGMIRSVAVRGNQRLEPATIMA